MLVNLSNDGWFHGSSELDMHLAVSVFRTIEHRVPLARAVNTGISALIDGNGEIRDTLPRLTETVLTVIGAARRPHQQLHDPGRLAGDLVPGRDDRAGADGLAPKSAKTQILISTTIVIFWGCTWSAVGGRRLGAPRTVPPAISPQVCGSSD